MGDPLVMKEHALLGRTLCMRFNGRTWNTHSQYSGNLSVRLVHTYPYWNLMSIDHPVGSCKMTSMKNIIFLNMCNVSKCGEGKLPK